MNNISRNIILIALLSFAVSLFAGCGTVRVQLRQKPYQGKMIVDGKPDFRRRQAVKVTRLFWGIVDKVVSPPVDWDYAERADYWVRLGGWPIIPKLGLTELQMNSFFQFMAMPGDTTDGAMTRAVGNRATPVPVDNYRYLIPAESDTSWISTMLFRITTLGVFWDAGYTSDNEKWGLFNEASSTAWFGRADTLIVMDKRGSFFVREFSFDPSETLRQAGRLAEELVVLGVQVALASQLVGIPTAGGEASGYDEEFAKRAVEVLSQRKQAVDGARSNLKKTVDEILEEDKKATASAKAQLKLVLKSRAAVLDEIKDHEPVDDLKGKAAVTEAKGG